MYEENRRFSWTSLFIKVIIVVIFILFTIWLLSLANKGMSKQINVLTDGVFSENMDKMKEVGKEYFTTERLPQKIGEIKVITLDEMYEKHLLLELKDKDGKACSAKDSYVSVEKLENEYQMKVNLKCGKKSDYILVIMGCYNYCKTDICERKEEEPVVAKDIEYQYSKTTGGSWGPWGSFTNWSTVSVTKNNYRDVQTKVVSEQYTYYKDEVKTVYVGEATCKNVSGYELVSHSDGYCTYSRTVTDSINPTCPSVSGYTVTGRDGFTCYYSNSTTSSQDPTCPSVSGYTLTGRSGFTCSYSKTTSTSTDPTCPSVSGYTLIGRDGFTCNYSKTTTTTKTATCPDGYTKSGSTCAKSTTSTTTKTATCPDGYTKSGSTCAKSSSGTVTTNPTCPSVSGYTYTGRSGFTCNYSTTTTGSSYSLSYYSSGSGSYVPSDTSTYHYEQTSADYQYVCNSSCAMQWYYTYKIYKKVYDTVTSTTTRTATCPDGYTKSGSTCEKTTTSTSTTNPTCPSVSGYTLTGRDGFTCSYSKTTTTSKTATCPDGYTKSGSTCVKSTTSTTTRTATCADGYTQSGNTCVKSTTSTTTKTAVCKDGYTRSGTYCTKTSTDYIRTNSTCPSNQIWEKGKCYKEETTRVEVIGTRDVTYYRYRLRSYVGGTTDYKWSSSNHDKALLDAGYKLTGKTRVKQMGGK